MTSSKSTLEFSAPEDMYTMSPQRITHIIQPHEWVTIKMGSGNELREWAIGMGFASLGFFQNAFNVGHWLYSKTSMSSWDVVATIFFAVLASAGIVLGIVCRGKKSAFDSAVREIDCREPRRFNPDAEGDDMEPKALTGPTVRGRDIATILEDALKKKPSARTGP